MSEQDFTKLDLEMRKALQAERRYLDALRKRMAESDDMAARSMQAIEGSLFLLHGDR